MEWIKLWGPGQERNRYDSVTTVGLNRAAHVRVCVCGSTGKKDE